MGTGEEDRAEAWVVIDPDDYAVGAGNDAWSAWRNARIDVALTRFISYPERVAELEQMGYRCIRMVEVDEHGT